MYSPENTMRNSEVPDVDEHYMLITIGLVNFPWSEPDEMISPSNAYLVGGDWNQGIDDFPYVGNVIIPTDFHIFSEG